MKDTELALLMDSFMRKIHFGLQAKAASFDKEKVGPGGGMVLLTLAEMSCPTLSELTKRVARDKSQMTRTVRSLEDKGLLVRQASSEDARVTLVQLTDKGQSVVEALQLAVAEIIDEILEPISQAEKETLRNLLGQALG